jgi:hypothetical protein
MTASTIHVNAQHSIVTLVERLSAAQFPAWADLPSRHSCRKGETTEPFVWART